MKQFLFSVLCCVLLFGCKSDDDSLEPNGDLEDLIIGDWNFLGNGLPYRLEVFRKW